MTKSTVLVLCSVAFLCAAGPLNAQSTTFVATVSNAATGAPIRDAEVWIVDAHLLAHTNWLGEAVIDHVSAGTHRVRVRKLGFAPADLDLMFKGDSVGQVFMMGAAPQSLDPVKTTASRVPPYLQPFETRRSLGIGRFLTQDQIEGMEKEWGDDFGVAVVSRFPGIRLTRNPSGGEVIVSTRGGCGGSMPGGATGGSVPGAPGGASGPRGSSGSQQGGGMISSCTNPFCPVLVFLDDMNIGTEDFGLVRTWDLAGAEFYSGLSVPPQYKVDGSGCGVLLLWTRAY